MNTLSKHVTSAMFAEAGHYDKLIARWSEITNSPERKNLTAADFLFYAILRGKDWRKGFTPITNSIKLENGGEYAGGLRAASYASQSLWHRNQFLSKIGDGIIDAKAFNDIGKLISRISLNTLPDQAYDQASVEVIARVLEGANV